MAKSPRRSLTVKGITYQRLKNWCAKNDRSMSSVAEELFNSMLDTMDEPVPEKLEVAETTKVDPEILKAHFTF